jgi:hypothetical protein
LTEIGAFGGRNQRHTRGQLRHALPGTETSVWIGAHLNPSESVNQPPLHHLPSYSDVLATDKLISFEKFISEQAMAKFQVQELMLDAIAKTAVAAFEPTSMKIFAQDGYTLNGCGQLQSKTFGYAEKA